MVGRDDWQTLSVHSYPVKALAGDYIRTSTGLILTAGPLLLVELLDSLKVILFLLSMMFVIFGIRTMIRQVTTVMLCDVGIRTAGWLVPAKAISWHHTQQMKLRYFSTRRDREAGWMQLQLEGQEGRLSLDSAIDGFEEIVARVTKCAGENGLALSAVTQENLAATGLAMAPGSEMSNTREYRAHE